MFLKVKRFKHLDDLLLEANLIQIGSGEPDVTGSQYTQEQIEEMQRMDEYLDKLIDKAIANDWWNSETIIKSKQSVERYIEYCKGRLARLGRLIKEAIERGGADHQDLLRSEEHTSELQSH